VGVIRVDPAQLGSVAGRIRAGISTLRLGMAGVLGVRGPLSAAALAWTGDPALARALDRFARAWDPVVTDLTDDVQRVADALDLLAAAYRDTEAALASSMAGAASARAP